MDVNATLRVVTDLTCSLPLLMDGTGLQLTRRYLAQGSADTVTGPIQVDLSKTSLTIGTNKIEEIQLKLIFGV